VSKKLPVIRLVAIEFEIDREPAAEGAKPLQQFLTAGFARDGEFSRPNDMNFDLIAAFEFERLHHGGRKANGETVAPFGDLHVTSFDTQVWNVYQSRMRVKEGAAVSAPHRRSGRGWVVKEAPEERSASGQA
jgi:hypothetical protein